MRGTRGPDNAWWAWSPWSPRDCQEEGLEGEPVWPGGRARTTRPDSQEPASTHWRQPRLQRDAWGQAPALSLTMGATLAELSHLRECWRPISERGIMKSSLMGPSLFLWGWASCWIRGLTGGRWRTQPPTPASWLSPLGPPAGLHPLVQPLSVIEAGSGGVICYPFVYQSVQKPGFSWALPESSHFP